PLSEAERIDRELAAGALEITNWELKSRHVQRGNPSYATGEAAFGLLSLFLRDFSPLHERVESGIARLQQLPRLLAQSRAFIPNAPAAWTERAIRDCDGLLAFLSDGLDRLLAAHPEIANEGERLRSTAGLVARHVEVHRAFLHKRLSANASHSVACGEEALKLLLRRGHFLEWDASAVERYAVEQLSEAEARLREAAAALGEPDWRQALRKLNTIHPTAENYYARYQEIWDEHQAAAIEHELLSWPDYPIRYVPRPDWVRSAAHNLYFLFYRAPAAFDRVPAVDYLVEPVEPEMPPRVQERILQSANDSVIKLNHVVHHGGIGHHVQNWHAYRAEPRIGRIAAVDCASRIALYCGGTMAEGWACYATSLMEETGFLTPLEQLSERHARVRMAARAIVDVRLHRGDFDLDQAAGFYQEHTAMSPQASQAEAVKNSLFPGTGLMYLTGTDQIRRLRQEISTREGSRFSLAGFHDRFLSFGSVPVALIARAMRSI
ncbi:MAG TPA: DUF885 family protein, partial [Thermomicrobiaceae bacterium]|nr:DUF885 family protein [Thermomicrobiaceae bacterium]